MAVLSSSAVIDFEVMFLIADWATRGFETTGMDVEEVGSRLDWTWAWTWRRPGTWVWIRWVAGRRCRYSCYNQQTWFSLFNRMQAEHSLELHAPFIAKCMAKRSFTLVPIMVGSLTADRCGECSTHAAESSLAAESLFTVDGRVELTRLRLSSSLAL